MKRSSGWCGVTFVYILLNKSIGVLSSDGAARSVHRQDCENPTCEFLDAPAESHHCTQVHSPTPPLHSTAIMATELTVQSERAFQKQPHIFLNHKRGSTAARSRGIGKGGRRWYKDVGLGFRTPKTAIDGSYIGMSLNGVTFSDRIRFGSEDGIGDCTPMWVESVLTSNSSRRQEVSLYRSHLHSRPYPHRHCRLDQDAPHNRHPPRVSPLHP